MCILLQPYSESYFLDCLLSHFFVLGLVIATWRGLWNFQFSFIFPDDVKYGDHFCLAVGYAIMLVVFMVEELFAMGALYFTKRGFWFKVIYEDICYFVIFFAHGILWRGAWNCTVRYMITDPEKGGWLCFCIGSVGLLALQNFGYVSGMGCVVDSSDEGREAFYPTFYLRYYILNMDSHSEEQTTVRDEISTIF